MNVADYSTCKDEKDRSKKWCVCGGHNARNVKKNKNHNGTRKRLMIRQRRKFVRSMKEKFGGITTEEGGLG